MGNSESTYCGMPVMDKIMVFKAIVFILLIHYHKV